MINRIVNFYFSATLRTKVAVETISNTLAERLNISDKLDFDFTVPKIREKIPEFLETDLVILGTPVIAGRVPNLLLPYLNSIKSKGSLGVSVVTYGNREFEDSLIELSKIMESAGMKVIAGGAFIGEHSFSRILGEGRPDSYDKEIMKDFAQSVADKITKNNLTSPIIPGKWPLEGYYKPRTSSGKHIDIRKVKPKTNENCIDCKYCANICPMGAIDYDDVKSVPGICMKCCACIKRCPVNAKYFDDQGYIYHKEDLENLYSSVRKEPETFL